MRPGVWALLGACLIFAACDDEAPFFVDTLILSDTIDQVGPYTVSTVVVDNRGVVEVTLAYQIGLPAAPITVNCEQSGSSDTWNCLIPGPRRTTRIYYALTARDSANKTARDPALDPDTYSFAITQREPPPVGLDAGTADRDRRDDATASDGNTGDRGAEDSGIEDAGAEDTPAEDAGGADHPTADSGVADHPTGDS